jgi:hypothetical protein
MFVEPLDALAELIFFAAVGSGVVFLFIPSNAPIALFKWRQRALVGVGLLLGVWIVLLLLTRWITG